MRNLVVLCVLVGVFFISLSNPQVAATNESFGAKCAMPNFERAYENAKAVFVGEVIGVKEDGSKKIFEFKVKKFWKGVEDKKVKVYTFENRRYQSPYIIGETFLVFAKDDEKSGLWDGRCSRSRNIDGYDPSLKEDLKSLGEGKTCISLSEGKEEKKRESK